MIRANARPCRDIERPLAELFFWRFRRKTVDTLFIASSVAFFLLALDRFFHAIAIGQPVSYVWTFFFRLAGFGLLIHAVLKKNLNGVNNRSSGKVRHRRLSTTARGSALSTHCC